MQGYLGASGYTVIVSFVSKQRSILFLRLSFLSAVFILYPICDVVLLFFMKESGLGSYDGNDVCSTIFCLSFSFPAQQGFSKSPNSGRLDVFFVRVATGMNA